MKVKDRRCYIHLLGLLLFPQIATASTGLAYIFQAVLIVVLGVQVLVTVTMLWFVFVTKNWRSRIILFCSVVGAILLIDLLPLVISGQGSLSNRQVYDIGLIYILLAITLPALALIFSKLYIDKYDGNH